MTVTTARCSWARSRNAMDKSLLARSLSNALTRSLNSGGGPSAVIAGKPLSTATALSAAPAVAACAGAGAPAPADGSELADAAARLQLRGVAQVEEERRVPVYLRQRPLPDVARRQRQGAGRG